MEYYYEISVGMFMNDEVYTPDEESHDVDVDEARDEALDQLEKASKKHIKKYFPENKIEVSTNDYEDELVYMGVTSDIKLQLEDLNHILFGEKEYFDAYTSQTFAYGEVHDYSYYELPYQDEIDIEIEVRFADISILAEYE